MDYLDTVLYVVLPILGITLLAMWIVSGWYLAEIRSNVRAIREDARMARNYRKETEQKCADAAYELAKLIQMQNDTIVANMEMKK